ncbi:LysM peptidoglycan-binding domain-containing protein [Zhouia spongiae]|uniref:LysM peptidoglycan-binding domain-containing protein n=1 Tax=Zhouia spongiae TaxID=2202721 RepID=A0ABY3YPF6_9FLAO|nr:LysM peptidoglycan-binding domain-containing protein [Zhouia spongiae]UNY99727.1 LysM peptidoglycan-binding domain-containing protein [Zhouia spongiae]
MKRILILIGCFTPFMMFSQEPTKVQQPDTIGKNQKEISVETSRDSISDEIKKLLKAEGRYQLKDHETAAKYDSLWLQELYESELFDTLYNDISHLNYEEVEYKELSTDTLKKRLEKLNQKTPFNVAYNPALESVIKMFLKNRRGFIQRMINKSSFYFPLFEEELDRNDIPLEMKYLSIVESALNPKAKSRVGATGLWQFMFQTGRMYGLEVNSYVDERCDPIQSTEAASKYLSRLYGIFGDWDLALAAYNSGPGNVSKAIRRSGGYENYWNLRPFLPRETAGYVPAFLTMMYIFEYAEEHGFKVDPRGEVAYFETDTIQVKKMISFDQISELIDIDVEEVQFFNPSYKIDVIPYIEDQVHVLRLPTKDIGKFVANEKAIYKHIDEELAKKEKPLPQLFKMDSQVTHRVRNGDVLGKIAQRYGVRVSEIKRWNGLRSNTIRVGQRLKIYPKKPVAVKKTSSSKSTVNTSGLKEYVVRKGDTLWGIANKFPGISVKNLQDWNDISGKSLKPGMKIKLCQC